MSEQKDFATIGDIRIADDVIAAIAAIAISEIDGVFLYPSISPADFRELIGKNRLGRGIKVRFSEEGVTLDLQIQVRYGVVVADAAKIVQDAVANAVESMTALHVTGVNVSVVGVSPDAAAK
ncbi:MAG: Asp23/Gls24 family envelope stress response protein [Eubacteriales bacterium]|nr:Asp23/Gls24 family envelope stress response protein [Eubacteriales bacterium]